MNFFKSLCALPALKYISFLASGFVFSFATAQDNTSHLKVWGGAAAGYSHLMSQSKSEVSKYGYHFRADGALSLRLGLWDTEAGGAWLYNNISTSKGEDTRTEKDGTVFREKDLSIRSRTGEMSLAVRREWKPNFRMGPIVRALLDKSVSFSKANPTAGPHFLTGASATLDTDFIPVFSDRLTAELTTDITIPHRQIILASVGFQIGFGPSSEPRIKEEVKVTPPPAPVVPAPLPKVRIVLDGQLINFDTAKSELEPRLDTFVRKLGAILKTHNALWQTLAIEGHTDSRGKLEYNIDLSSRRASTIKRLLLESGVAPAKVSAEGFGPNQLAVNPEKTPADYRKNRRVVFIFEGVVDASVMYQEIKNLRKAMGLQEQL